MTLPRHIRHGGNHDPMEANEVQELKEHAEHVSGDSALRPVAFTMSLLAVLVAITTVLGHRTHTLKRCSTRTRRQTSGNQYQSQKIRAYNTGLNADLLNNLTVADQQKTQETLKRYADHQAKWNDDLKEDQEKG